MMEWLVPEEQSAKPSSALPRFYTRQVEHKAKSLEAGRPIFVDVDYVEIRIAGDNKNVIDRKVSQKDINRWPREYKKFKEGVSDHLEGTPIDQWTSISASRAKELQAVNVFTVEQLSQVSDSSLGMIGMDGRSLRTRAQAFIKQSKEQGFAERVAYENQILKDDIEFLKSKIGPLLDRLDTMEKELNSLKGIDDATDTKPAITESITWK